MTHAIAYLRTSSATNVGGDSDVRQRAAIQAYANTHSIEIVQEYYDAAVPGTDEVAKRPGFAAMLARIEGNGVRLVLVEDASRFARDLVVQEGGIRLLQEAGVTLMTAGGENLTDSADSTRVMVRQILGAVAQNEKTRLVAKMRGARDRKSAELGHRVEGAKRTAYKDDSDVVAAIRQLRTSLPKPTLQAITTALAEQGVTTTKGKPLALTQVARIVARIAA